MLAYCVQDATVVDVEKRRNPSKHYVSTAPARLPGTPGGPAPLPLLSPGAECARGSLAVAFLCRARDLQGELS